MSSITRRAIATVFAGGIALAGATAPAQAAPVITGGLVNVTITDVDLITGNNISVVALNGLTLQAAAQVCGVKVNVLAVDLGPDGTAVCSVTQDQDSVTTITTDQRRGNNG